MKAKAFFTLALLNLALLAPSHGQRRGQRGGSNVPADDEPEVPLMRPEEAQAVQEQKNEFFSTLRPVAQAASQSTVWIWADTGGNRGRRPVGFGTVVGDGTKVLTKWSEIAMAQGTILAVGHDSASAKATVTGVYQDEDLALLKLEGAKFTPVTLAKDAPPKLGRMLVAASPEEIPAGFGVVAVEARSLREKDQGFLGVGPDTKYEGTGVRIAEVTKGSGASEAGLQNGDVILSVAGRAINSLFEMRTALNGHGPGERVEIRYKRGGKEQTAEALLKEKPEFAGIPNGRLRMMEKMGTSLSLVRNGFPSVIQTDMPLVRDRCGGPVVDLDGKVVGIAIARADRTRSFVIPSSYISRMLEGAPLTEAAVREAEAAREKENKEATAGNEGGEGGGRPAPKMVPMKPQSAEVLRRNLEDMERFMERMQEETKGIDE